jgi:hypothetical protein
VENISLFNGKGNGKGVFVFSVGEEKFGHDFCSDVVYMVSTGVREVWIAGFSSVSEEVVDSGVTIFFLKKKKGRIFRFENVVNLY